MSVQYYNIERKDKTDFTTYINEYTVFAEKLTEFMNLSRDYGNGDTVKSFEAATIYLIERSPGITVSEIAKIQGKTKGTVSSVVSKLEKKGYVYKENRGNNSKTKHLYATEKGVQLNILYSSFLIKHISKTEFELLKTCSREELNAFSKVIHEWLKILSKD